MTATSGDPNAVTAHYVSCYVANLVVATYRLPEHVSTQFVGAVVDLPGNPVDPSASPSP